MNYVKINRSDKTVTTSLDGFVNGLTRAAVKMTTSSPLIGRSTELTFNPVGPSFQPIRRSWSII